ncbi:DNA primase, partial [Odoribacter sp. OttesenSCG-928-A06]|nr:DNA primase [Odoribacter sp. OttesenSCG-928-A06]
IQNKQQRNDSCEVEEMVLIRYLLLFGVRKLYEDDDSSMSVGEYIINELKEDELKMVNPHMDRILNEFIEQRNSAHFNPEKFFIGHTDPHICNLVANILSEQYELSKIWTTKENVMVSEDMLLTELLPKIVDNYKMRRLEMMSGEANNKILEMQSCGNEEELINWLKKKNAIDRIRTKLNQKLRRTGIK